MMKKLAVASPNKFKYSETFIHMHANELLADTILLHGGYFPVYWSNGMKGEDHTISSLAGRGNFMSLFKNKSGSEVGGGSGKTMLGEFLSTTGISVVLAEYGPTGVALMDVCTDAGIPLWVHFHGYDAYRQDILGEQGKLYPKLFANAKGMIVVSNNMRKQLISLGADEKKVHLIPYGVDLEKFPFYNKQTNNLQLVYIGRFVDKKSPELVIAVFEKVLEYLPQATLKMAGEGPLLKGCKDYVENNGLGRSVVFCGRLNHGEVLALLREGTLLIQHSRVTADGDSEGLPLVILEAMASGTPVVSTIHGGIPDAIIHEETGLLSPENNIEAMAGNILRLLTSSEFSSMISENARKVVEANYRKEKYLSDLRSLIQI